MLFYAATGKLEADIHRT